MTDYFDLNFKLQSSIVLLEKERQLAVDREFEEWLLWWLEVTSPNDGSQIDIIREVENVFQRQTDDE